MRHDSDLKLDDLSEITEELYEEIRLLEPFGEGNLEPIFEFDGRVSSKRLLKEKHLALTIRDRNNKAMKMMAFHAPEEWQVVESGDEVRAQFVLTKNEWRGNVSIEGEILSLERL